MERQLQAPLSIDPQASLPLDLPQAATLLAGYLTEHAAFADTGTRALLSRLHAGIKLEMELETEEDGPIEQPEPVGPFEEKRTRVETEEERKERKRARKAAKAAARAAKGQSA